MQMSLKARAEQGARSGSVKPSRIIGRRACKREGCCLNQEESIPKGVGRRREGGDVGRREGGREGEREGGRRGGREGGREGGKEGGGGRRQKEEGKGKRTNTGTYTHTD
jgi:hypothetical protein